ncbi:MAG: hypothetical protein ABIH68_00365 [bacterium]
MADDQEKQSLRRQVEILLIQKDTFSKQLDKLRKEIAMERADARKNQIKLLDEIRAKDIEIKATKRFLEKREITLRDGLRDEFGALKIEKERLEEVSKELAVKRNMIDALIRARKLEFEEKLKKEEELFERAKEDSKREINSLNSEISKNLQELASANEKFAKEKEVFQNSISQKEKKIETLKTELNKKEEEIQALNGRITELEKTNSRTKDTADTLEKDLSQKENNYKTLKSEKKILENENRKVAVKINSLESEKTELIEKVAQLQLTLRTQPEKRKPSEGLKKKFKCSECGGIICESDVVCPHCGEKFE